MRPTRAPWREGAALRAVPVLSVGAPPFALSAGSLTPALLPCQRPPQGQGKVITGPRRESLGSYSTPPAKPLILLDSAVDSFPARKIQFPGLFAPYNMADCEMGKPVGTPYSPH